MDGRTCAPGWACRVAPWWWLAFAVMVWTAGGCAETAVSDTPDAAGGVEVVGTDELRWEPEELTVPAGEVEVDLVCEPAVNHNLVIVETGREIAACSPGQTTRGVLDLEPGAYTFLCTVPGHSATMRGELTVEG